MKIQFNVINVNALITFDVEPTETGYIMNGTEIKIVDNKVIARPKDECQFITIGADPVYLF